MGAPDIEALADAILKASGSALRYYSMPTVRAAILAATAEAVEAGRNDADSEMRETLDSIVIYASDTLSGRTDGPDDRTWQREAVRELRKRAIAALAKADGRS